jgi:hypothetical protein
MNEYLKYFLSLLILFMVICCGTLVINSSLSLGWDETSALFLILSFAATALLSLIVYLRGLSREADVQTMHTFAAVGIKFLAELFIALIWFGAAKKTSAEYILLFFVLYLAFSMFSIIVILKTLKQKSL